MYICESDFEYIANFKLSQFVEWYVDRGLPDTIKDKENYVIITPTNMGSKSIEYERINVSKLKKCMELYSTEANNYRIADEEGSFAPKHNWCDICNVKYTKYSVHISSQGHIENYERYKIVYDDID